MDRNRKTIIFLPFMRHLKVFLSTLADDYDVYALSRFREDIATNKKEKLILEYDPLPTLGIRTLLRFFSIPAQPPNLSRDLGMFLGTHKTNALVIFDFYHWYTLQALRYKKKYPHLKLIIYSETKCWPNRLVSRISMRLFLWFVMRNVKSIYKILVYTEQGKLWWHENAPEADVDLLPAPVDELMFRPAQDRCWLPDSKLRILMNARYVAYKRHEDLLRAVVMLRQQGEKFHITFVGRTDDDGRINVQRLVEQYGLVDAVTFLDPLPATSMSELYHQNDVLVLPSYNEAIGMVVPEAMACGVPTITSDTVGANVYIEEGKTGFVFKTGDVGDLLIALRACYKEGRIYEMGRAARLRIEKDFTPAQISSRFQTILNEQY